MRYQAFLTFSILSLVACSGDPVGLDGKALHSVEPKSTGNEVADQFAVDKGVLGDDDGGTGSGGTGVNQAGTGAGGSGGPVNTGSAGSGGPVNTGSAGSGGPENTGSAGSGGPENTGSAGSAGPDATLAPVCGNGFCEEGESHSSCEADCCELTAAGACVAVCGNRFLEEGEDQVTCPADFN
jgi:hypothetical protein